MYCALEAYVTNNGTTVASPLDPEQWRAEQQPFQLNGCVRTSGVYTEGCTGGQRSSKVYIGITEGVVGS